MKTNDFTEKMQREPMSENSASRPVQETRSGDAGQRSQHVKKAVRIIRLILDLIRSIFLKKRSPE